MVRTRTVAFVAACCAALALSIPAAFAASPQTQSGGAAGVVAAVVQVQDTLNNLNLQVLNGSNVEVVTVKDSLNNVLQNAQFLNNITILQNFLNNNTCLAVCQSLNNVLNNNNVAVSNLVAINVLSGGLVIFQR